MHNYHNLCKRQPENEEFPILLSSAYTMGLKLYIVIDENNIRVLMFMKMLGRVQKRARKELKAFLVLLGQLRHADLVKWT